MSEQDRIEEKFFDTPSDVVIVKHGEAYYDRARARVAAGESLEDVALELALEEVHRTTSDEELEALGRLHHDDERE